MTPCRVLAKPMGPRSQGWHGVGLARPDVLCAEASKAVPAQVLAVGPQEGQLGGGAPAARGRRQDGHLEQARADGARRGARRQPRRRRQGDCGGRRRPGCALRWVHRKSKIERDKKAAQDILGATSGCLRAGVGAGSCVTGGNWADGAWTPAVRVAVEALAAARVANGCRCSTGERPRGYSLLHLAAGCGGREAVRYLLSQRADKDGERCSSQLPRDVHFEQEPGLHRTRRPVAGASDTRVHLSVCLTSRRTGLKGALAARACVLPSAGPRVPAPPEAASVLLVETFATHRGVPDASGRSRSHVPCAPACAVDGAAPGGCTPLHSAVLGAAPACVEALLEAGADANLEDADGR
jgi:Ankyrin repeat